MNQPGDRLKQLIEALSLTNKAFAEKLGIAPNYISMMIKGRKKISDKLLFSITKVMPSVNSEWISEGKGDMFIKESSFILTNNNEKLEIDKIVDIIFLHKEKFEENEKFKTYIGEKINKGINEYQTNLIKELKEKGSN